MTIFLTILKIIGIVLLSLLGFVLLVLLVVLYAPIHYNSEGKYDDENKPLIEVRAHWICHIVRFYFVFDGKEKKYYLKVFNKQLRPRVKKRKSRKKKKTDYAFDSLEEALSEDEPEIEAPEETPEASTDKAVAEDTETNDAGYIEETAQTDTSEVTEETAETDDLYSIEEKSETTGEEKKKRSSKKRPSFIKRLKHSINNFKFKFKEFCDKIKSGKLKAEDMVVKLRDPRTEKAVRELLFEVKYLLWHMRPRKFRMYVHYGFEDPSHTGELYGFYNSLYGIHMGIPVVVPDFDKKCLDGNYYMKGYLPLIFVLISFLRLYFSKDFKRLWAMIKNR